MNRFELCNQRAEERKRAHYERRAAQAKAHYERHPECGEGVDVVVRCGRDWWKDASLWPDDKETEELTRLGKFDKWLAYAPVYQELVKRPTERDCVGRMRRACQRAALLEGTEPVMVVNYDSLWKDLVREAMLEAA